MNTTGDSDDTPELPVSGTPGMPLSAPVAGGMLQTREPGFYVPELDDPRPHLGAALPSAPAQPAELRHRRAGSGADVPEAAAVGSPAGQDEAPAATEPAYPPQAAPAAGHLLYATPTAGHRAPAGQAAGDPADADRAARPAERAFPPRSPARSESVLADWSPDDPPEDPNRVLIRKHLEAVRVSAASASSWLETSVHYARLLNRDGIVPVTARFTREDIDFLGRAREQVLGFAELGLRLVELHAPLDAGGISTDPSSPILRCRSCMWRWPCPTFRMLAEALSHLPSPGSPPAR